jgi:hypothetical protein
MLLRNVGKFYIILNSITFQKIRVVLFTVIVLKTSDLTELCNGFQS